MSTLAAARMSRNWERRGKQIPTPTKAQARMRPQVEAKAEACASPEGLSGSPGTESTTASCVNILRCISQASIWDISEEEELKPERLPLAWWLTCRAQMPGALGFARCFSAVRAEAPRATLNRYGLRLPFKLTELPLPGLLGLVVARFEAQPGPTPGPCAQLVQPKSAQDRSKPVPSRDKRSLRRSVSDVETRQLSDETSAERNKRTLRRSVSADETRQLSDLLCEDKLSAAVRSYHSKIKAFAEPAPSPVRLLRILAQAHALWNARDSWSLSPEETWGIFLERMCLIMAAPRVVQPVAVLPKDDWRRLRGWCYQVFHHLESILEA
ncbi:unnamed protein product, partial [Effrenium voratum]